MKYQNYNTKTWLTTILTLQYTHHQIQVVVGSIRLTQSIMLESSISSNSL